MRTSETNLDWTLSLSSRSSRVNLFRQLPSQVISKLPLPNQSKSKPLLNNYLKHRSRLHTCNLQFSRPSNLVWPLYSHLRNRWRLQDLGERPLDEALRGEVLELLVIVRCLEKSLLLQLC